MEKNMSMKYIKMIFFLGTFLFLVIPNAYSKDADFEIIEKNVQFQSPDLQLKVGQTIRLVNKDPYIHMSQIRKLNKHGIETDIVAGGIEQVGSSQDLVLSEPGNYKLRCIFHDGMILNIKAAR